MTSLADAVLLSGSLRWAAQLVTWAITLFVARLLSPADYGVAGLVMTVASIGMLLADAGIGTAVQMLERQDRAVLRQLNLIALSVSLTVALVVAGAAVVLAPIFREPAVGWLLPMAALGVVVEGLRAVPAASAARELRFGTVARADFARAVGASIVTLLIAVFVGGPASLVLGNVAGALVGGALLLKTEWLGYARPQPHLLSRIIGVTRLTFIGRIAWQTWTSADMLVLGKVTAANVVGSFGLAKTLASLPSEKLLTVLVGVTGPVMAEHANDRPALRGYFLRLTELVALVIGVPLVGLCLVADLAVPLALGQQWRDSVPPLRWLCLGAVLSALGAVPGQIAGATGGVRRTVRGSVIAAMIAFPAFWVGARQGGAVGAAGVWPALQLVIQGPGIRHAMWMTGAGWRDLVHALVPAGKASVACTIGVSLARVACPTDAGNAVRLVLLVAAGMLAVMATLITGSTEGVSSVRRAIARLVRRVGTSSTDAVVRRAP